MNKRFAELVFDFELVLLNVALKQTQIKNVVLQDLL